MTDGRPRPFCGRVLPALLLAGGILCLGAALTVAGGVAALLLDALGSNPSAGDCVGAELVPMALLAGSALLGLAGLGLSVAGGVLFWRLTAPPPPAD